MSTPNVSHRNKFYKFYRKKVITDITEKVEIDITKGVDETHHGLAMKIF